MRSPTNAPTGAAVSSTHPGSPGVKGAEGAGDDGAKGGVGAPPEPISGADPSTSSCNILPKGEKGGMWL